MVDGRVIKIKIEYELTKEDYLNFNLYHLNHSKMIKKSLFIQRYIVSIVFLIVPFIFSSITEMPLYVYFPVFALIWLLWIIFYKKYFDRIAIKRIEKMLNEGKNLCLLGKYSVETNEDGFIEICPNGESKITWNGIDKVVENELYIFIYIDSVRAYIIPKRAFTNDNLKNEFLQSVTEKTKF